MRNGTAKRGKHFRPLTSWSAHQEQRLQNAFDGVPSEIYRGAWAADLQKRRPVLESLIRNPVVTASVNIEGQCYSTISDFTPFTRGSQSFAIHCRNVSRFRSLSSYQQIGGRVPKPLAPNKNPQFRRNKAGKVRLASRHSDFWAASDGDNVCTETILRKLISCTSSAKALRGLAEKT
jgi:hypothetical protein